MLGFQIAMMKAATDAAHEMATAFAGAIEMSAKQAAQEAPNKQPDDTPDQPVAESGRHEGQAGRDAKHAAFGLPQIPETGKSWYRQPFENPILAFWDQVLQPWRTIVPGGAAMPGFNPFVGLPPMFAFAGPNPFGRISFEQQHNAFGDFSRVLDSWASACQAMAAPVIEHSGATPDNTHGNREVQAPRDRSGTAGDGIGENLQAIVAFHSDAGMAVARAFFPDHTVVKLELPMPNFRFEPDSDKAPGLKDDK